MKTRCRERHLKLGKMKYDIGNPEKYYTTKSFIVKCQVLTAANMKLLSVGRLRNVVLKTLNDVSKVLTDSIIRANSLEMMKITRMRWAGHVKRRYKKCIGNSGSKLEKMNGSEDLNIGGRIIFKWVLRK